VRPPLSTTVRSVSPRPGSRRLRAKFQSVFGLFTIFTLALTAIAQQETKDLSEASLEELSNIQVYSASKHMQSASDAPSSVTVITRDEIQKYGFRTLADILESVRGFYITCDRQYSYVGVSGVNRPEAYNSRVLLLIDGHRTNNNIYDQALIGPEFALDIDLIERVEIVRGPSSSLYGTSAFLAVINVITRKADQLKGWELAFDPASFGAYQGRVSYGATYRGMDIVLSAGFYNSLGQTLFYPEFNTPGTDNGINRNSDYESYQHYLATVSFRGFTLQGVFSDRNKGIPTGAFATVFDDPQNHDFDSLRYFDLSYQRPVTQTWDLAARTAVSRHVYDGVYAYSPTQPGGANVLRFRARDLVDWRTPVAAKSAPE
jgi:outer membrane receptor for ferrienterochelin and colicins